MNRDPQNPHWQAFETRESLVEALSQHISQTLRHAIEERGNASLLVSGGNSPKPLFDSLSNAQLAWEKVNVLLSDERWVDPTDKDSNEYLVRTSLLINQAESANFIGLKTDDSTAEAGMNHCHEKLSVLNEPYDIGLLGMGNDGHTASIFPGTKELEKAVCISNELYCQSTTPLDAPYERMTLTLPTLLNGREIILLLFGEEKKQTFDMAMKEGDNAEMPIRYILKQPMTTVNVYWAP